MLEKKKFLIFVFFLFKIYNSKPDWQAAPPIGKSTYSAKSPQPFNQWCDLDVFWNLEYSKPVEHSLYYDWKHNFLPLKVPWHKKVLISNIIKNGVYSAKKLKLYMY